MCEVCLMAGSVCQRVVLISPYIRFNVFTVRRVVQNYVPSSISFLEIVSVAFVLYSWFVYQFSVKDASF